MVHCKKEPYDIYIGRPSKWGNLYSHKEGTLAKFKVDTVDESIEKYQYWLESNHMLLHDLHELKGKTLGCWCKPGPCHGDVLVKFVDLYV